MKELYCLQTMSAVSFVSLQSGFWFAGLMTDVQCHSSPLLYFLWFSTRFGTVWTLFFDLCNHGTCMFAEDTHVWTLFEDTHVRTPLSLRRQSEWPRNAVSPSIASLAIEVPLRESHPVKPLQPLVHHDPEIGILWILHCCFRNSNS